MCVRVRVRVYVRVWFYKKKNQNNTVNCMQRRTFPSIEYWLKIYARVQLKRSEHLQTKENRGLMHICVNISNEYTLIWFDFVYWWWCVNSVRAPRSAIRKYSFKKNTQRDTDNTSIQIHWLNDTNKQHHKYIHNDSSQHTCIDIK